MLVRQARSTTFKIQVNFISYGVEYWGSRDSANILNKEKGDSISGNCSLARRAQANAELQTENLTCLENEQHLNKLG